ncbi:DUF2189 domain-containing protein [Kordiimonas aquimaris]|uniref:DUF2189 domain-containing protein n=1 Tax=Kordiimonas aquimaris TaxID=707591 RepID=UPI0021CF6186|nr:DUF2189 domain-containing protein [Kordiimonas aquimaris]
MTYENASVAQRPPTMAKDFARGLPVHAPFDWLKAGVRDTFASPVSSLSYGLAVFLISVAFVAVMFRFGFSYFLFPAIAGFMVLGPFIATGLYGKSRLLAAGAAGVSTREMLSVKPKSPGQLLLVGIVLMLIMTFWLRFAVVLYALFFGLAPFGGLEQTIDTLFLTNTGRTLLMVGSAVGGLMAAFSFSISAFSIPMLMNEKKDTMTAVALSVVIAWMNKSVVFVWGSIVLALFLFSVANAFVGLIVIFPILGHGTWHAYQAMRSEEALVAAENEA